jgi:hypothetical protein
MSPFVSGCSNRNFQKDMIELISIVSNEIVYLVTGGASETGQVEDGVTCSHDQFVGTEWQTTAIATSHPE